MAKAYTDIEQSQKLAKILPLDSADMHYINGGGQPVLTGWAECEHDYDDIPCWSLDALMELLPETITVVDKEDEEDYTDYILCIFKEDEQWTIYYEGEAHSALTAEWLVDETSENLIDAVYNVIVELHNKKLL